MLVTRSRLAIWVIVLTVIVGMLPLAAVSAQELAQPKVIVNTSFLNVRSGPGAIYSIVGTLPGGTELPVIGRTRDASWWQVESPFGIGWVSAEFVIPRGDFRPVPVVQVSGVVEQPRAVVAQNTANVYVFPDTASSLLGLALVGSELPVVGQTADGVWWQVETNVGLGWVRQVEVSLRGNAASVPVVSAGSSTGAAIVPAATTGSTGTAATSGPAGGETPGITDNSRAVVYVYTQTMPLHVAADSGSATVGTMYTGDRAEVLDFDPTGDWALVLFLGDLMGWVPVSDVAMSDPTDWRTQIWWEGPGLLDLKSQPDMSSSVSVSIPGMQRLIVTNDAEGPNGGWLQVTHDMGTGWVQAMDIAIIRNGPRTQSGATTTGAMAGNMLGQPQLSGTVIQPSAASMVSVPQPAQSYIIVNTSYLNIRSGPGANYTVVATVNGGDELDISASTPDGAWFQVRGAFGSGWVNSEFVIFRGDFGNVSIMTYADAVGQTTSPEAVVSAPVNVYLGAGVETGLLGTAPAGLNMPVIGRSLDGNWLQVQTSSGPGWVLASTVTFRGDFGQVPVVR